MEKKKKNHILSLLFLLALMIVTFFILLKDQPLSTLAPIIEKASPVFLLLGLCMMAIYVGCEALNIYIIMKTLQQKIPFRRCFAYACVGFYFSSITPSASGGQPAQVYYMKRDGINISHSSLTLLIITVAFQFVMLLYGIVMYIWQYDFVSGSIHSLKWLLAFGVIFNLLLCGFILMAIFSKNISSRLVTATINFLCKIRIIKNPTKAIESAEHQLLEYSSGAEYIKQNPLMLAAVIGITVVQKTAFYLVPFFVYCAFGLSHHSAIEIVAIQALLTIAVSSLPLPGAVGVTETSFLTLFQIFFTPAMIMPAMLLSRGISFYVILILSAIVTMAIHLRSGSGEVASRHRQSVG